MLDDVLKFQRRHKNCDVVLTSDYMMGDEERYYFEVDYTKPLPTKEQFEKHKDEILQQQIQESYEIWRGLMIVISDEALFEFFLTQDEKLELGFVQEPVGGYGGTMSPSFTTEEECLNWLTKNAEKYGANGKLKIVKHSGVVYPYMNEVQELFTQRLMKQLTETDYKILEALFVGKHKLESRTMREISEKTGILYVETKKVCEKLDRLGFVNIWFPAGEEVHITPRGCDALLRKCEKQESK